MFRRFSKLIAGFVFLNAAHLAAQDPFQQDVRKSLLEIQAAKDSKISNELAKLEDIKRQMPSVELIQLIADGKNTFSNAELVEDQRTKITALQKDCLRKLKDLLGPEVVANRLDWANYKYVDWTRYPKGTREKFEEIKNECKDQLFEIFLPVQLKGFANTGLVNGIPRIVTESAIQDVIGLSDQQKRKIQIESNKLAKEVEEFVHEARKKAAKIALENLTEEQRQKLFAIYGEKQVMRLLASVPIRVLFRQHLFTDKPPKGSSEMTLPKGKHVDWTNVESSAKKK